jgi:hypothetical protein
MTDQSSSCCCTINTTAARAMWRPKAKCEDAAKGEMRRNPKLAGARSPGQDCEAPQRSTHACTGVVMVGMVEAPHGGRMHAGVVNYGPAR